MSGTVVNLSRHQSRVDQSRALLTSSTCIYQVSDSLGSNPPRTARANRKSIIRLFVLTRRARHARGLKADSDWHVGANNQTALRSYVVIKARHTHAMSFLRDFIGTRINLSLYLGGIKNWTCRQITDGNLTYGNVARSKGERRKEIKLRQV